MEESERSRGELKCDYSSSICGWDSRAIRVLRAGGTGHRVAGGEIFSGE